MKLLNELAVYMEEKNKRVCVVLDKFIPPNTYQFHVTHIPHDHNKRQVVRFYEFGQQPAKYTEVMKQLIEKYHQLNK